MNYDAVVATVCIQLGCSFKPKLIFLPFQLNTIALKALPDSHGCSGVSLKEMIPSNKITVAPLPRKANSRSVCWD